MIWFLIVVFLLLYMGFHTFNGTSAGSYDDAVRKKEEHEARLKRAQDRLGSR